MPNAHPQDPGHAPPHIRRRMCASLPCKQSITASPDVYVFGYISGIYGCFLGLNPYPHTNDTVGFVNGVGGTVTGKRRWVSLYVLCMGMLMIVLDATVVNVALPAIQDDLGFTQSGLAWVVNAYLI